MPRHVSTARFLQSHVYAHLMVAVLGAPFREAAANPSASVDEPHVVESADGQLRGLKHGASVVFRGIPYARPPVGELRWREPQPVVPWMGVRDATRAASACTQAPAGLNEFIAPLAKAYGAHHEGDPVESSEDCLYLNVRTPGPPPGSALPVMVWLHGGANTAGSGSQSAYDGEALVSRGVVLVTLNYRLGIIGFFSHPELSAESPHRSSGNYGLLDQLAALQWVQKNISRFGGDPDNVTLFGESAGAIDAGLLMTSPLSAGLFKRVISQSGPALGPAATRAEAEAAGAAVGRAAPGRFSSPLQNLRSLPASRVAKLAEQVSGATALVVDGWVLPRAPQQAFAQGAIQPVDLLIGLNGREFSAFRVGAAARRAVKPEDRDGAGNTMRNLADAVRPYYGGWTYVAMAGYLGKALFDKDVALDQAANDMLAACPIGAMATLVHARGQKVFVYRFDRIIPGQGADDLGAFHGLELPYVFRAFGDHTWRWLPFTSADFRLSDEIQRYWTRFARTGNPNSPGLPDWPAWNNDDEPFLRIDVDGGVVARHDFSPRLCNLSLDRLRQRLN